MNETAAREVLKLAESVQGISDMPEASALCLATARKMVDAGAWKHATERALKSLLYAVGVYGPAYRQACSVLTSNP